ncbi:uncharacterized protein LOC135221652 isoform X2 [Macrobrachium nipponense]|uniref:uncharacterized protein LOC135221652 isoform X2 n=1 Tax=Macrobrachium nipponense TaxID=159736 RepID=UPI0030C81DE3
MSESAQSSPRQDPADLTLILRKIREVLEDRKYRRKTFDSKDALTSAPIAPDEDDDGELSSTEGNGNLDDVKEAFGACQTIEWKEQEYRYLRSKVMGHRRRDTISGSSSALLGASTIPAVHKLLLRSLSTPNAPQLANCTYKTFLRQRRSSLAQEIESPTREMCGCGGPRDAKPRRRKSGVSSRGKLPFESDASPTASPRWENPMPVCAKIISNVKSSAWSSRESLLSIPSRRSLESSEEDVRSVILNPSIVSEACDNDSKISNGIARSVSEETLKYHQENNSTECLSLQSDGGGGGGSGSRADTPKRECEGGHALGDVCHSCVAAARSTTTSSSNQDDSGGLGGGESASPTPTLVSSIFDSIPHIDSSSEDDDEGGNNVSKASSSSSSPVKTGCGEQPQKKGDAGDAANKTTASSFVPEYPPLCQPEEDLYANEWQIATARRAIVVQESSGLSDDDDEEDADDEDPCINIPSPRGISDPVRSYTSPALSVNDVVVPAAPTGGVCKDGSQVVEVLKCWDATLPHWLAKCCGGQGAHCAQIPTTLTLEGSSPSSPSRSSNARPQRHLLLIPAAHLIQHSHHLKFLKEAVRDVKCQVCIVSTSPSEAEASRAVLQREALQQFEVLSQHELSERVSSDQLTSFFGGTLEYDHSSWRSICNIRDELLKELSSCAVLLEASVRTYGTPSSVSLGSLPNLNHPRRPSTSLDPSAPDRSSDADLQETRKSLSSAKALLRQMDSQCQKLNGVGLARSWLGECSELIHRVEMLLDLLLSQRASDSHRQKMYQREANSVVTWLLGRGEETLARHQTLADTLTGITRQETEFLKFYSVAMAYEWALEAMKVVGRVKSEGLASPEQVGAAARALTTYLEEHPPIPEDTFTAMNALATNLNNHTLLQQCKMAQVRCQETNELLRSRQAVLQKAKRQMEFDCQSFVDLGEVLGGGEEMSPLAWLACSPLNASGRRRSVSSVSSRPRESLSRCPSLDTDDDSVFLDPPPPPPPSKIPLEGRTSLGGIKEVRESAEDLQQSASSPNNTMQKHPSSTPSGTATSSSGSSGTSGTSSCSSSDSSGPISINNKFMKRSSTWQYGIVPKEHSDENSGLDDGVPLSPTSAKSIPSFSVNSHLLIRGSQLNLSFNTDELSQEEVKKSKTLLMIMRELIQTERDYVSSLEYIIENYIPELMREDIPQALRGQRNVIFGNIEKIYEFHSGYFLRALEACEMRPFTVGSIFLRYESQFYLYALYNKNKPKSDALMSEYGSAFFRGMQLELEDRMDLASYLLKPVQRMGKYALILKQLLKECSRGDENYDDLMGAQEMVQFQLRHGNDLLAMDSLRDCDVNLKEQGRLLRQGEFVVWEGSRAKKSVRHVFLFEDLILFSKSRRDPEKKTLDIFQYKHSMKMTDIGLTEQVGDSSTKFEIWFRKRKPSDTYLLQAPNTEVKESWTEEISKLLWRQALRNRTMRLHEMSSMGIGNKPCLDIRPSEDQISDRSISINQLNKAPRLRTGSISTIGETNGVGKRPHSIISVSSSSASSSASSASSVHSSAVCPTYVGTLNLGFEPGDSPRALHRSVTRTSQCSAESGILADMYSGGDEDAQSHRRVERSNSTVTTISVDSALSPVSSTSPISPTSLTLPSSLTTISNIKPSDVIYEAPSAQSVPKESPAKTLLTTEV